MPVYNTNVIIHVCVMKDLNECSITTTDLRDGIIKEARDSSWLQTGLRKDQIIKYNYKAEEEDRKLDFKRSLIVGVDSVIQKSTIFRKSVRVIDTLTRVLREGDRLDLDITQHFNKGINLNTLYGIENEDLPASAFLIVETVGDRIAKVIDNKINKFNKEKVNIYTSRICGHRKPLKIKEKKLFFQTSLLKIFLNFICEV